MRAKTKRLFGCMMAFAMVAATINMPQSIDKVEAATDAAAPTTTYAKMADYCDHTDANNDNLCDTCSGHMIETGICYNTTYYSLDKYTGKLTISGTGQMYNASFQNNALIQSVEIEKGVTFISGEAFINCSNLTSVSIPEGVTELNDNTFSGCSSLESVSLPYGLNSIGIGAFSGCSSLTTISIPTSVIYIHAAAFSDCTNLESISIPSRFTGIEKMLSKIAVN